MKEKALSFISLFTSFGTLICCALSVLLVSIGLGATVVASLISSFPWLVTLSRHKEWVFLGAGALSRFENLKVLRAVGVSDDCSSLCLSHFPIHSGSSP
jgi:hypothetical protein